MPDVVVIGAGAMGLGIARALRRRGATVTVVERGQPGRAASWASAGIISAPSGRRAAPNLELQRLSYGLWPAFAEEVWRESGMDPELRLMGCLTPAWSEADARSLDSLVRTGAVDHGELLHGRALREAEPGLGPEIVAALRFPGGNVDNRRLCRALELCIRAAGVTLRTGAEVRRISAEGGRVRGVELAGGALPADAVVVAAGAWTGGLAGCAPAVPVVPQRGQILALDQGAATLRHVILNPDDPYLVPRADGRIVVGATREMAGWDASPTAGGIAWLLSDAIRTVTALAACAIVEQWVGFRPLSADGVPTIGKGAADGLYFLTGHGPSGIGPLPGSLALLTALMFGEEPPIEPGPYDPMRWS